MDKMSALTIFTHLANARQLIAMACIEDGHDPDAPNPARPKSDVTDPLHDSLAKIDAMAAQIEAAFPDIATERDRSARKFDELVARAREPGVVDVAAAQEMAAARSGGAMPGKRG
jgi:hypothetical protein